MKPRKKDKIAGILGLGNLLMGDEGFGIHVIRHIESRYEIEGDVRLLDGGTAGIALAPFLEENDPVIVVDALALDEEPGSIRSYTRKELKQSASGLRMSPHQVGLVEILELCELRGEAPGTLELIGVVPAVLETGIELSPLLEPLVPEVARLVLKRLSEVAGVRCRPKEESGRA